MKDQVRSLLQQLTPEDRNCILQEMLAQALVTLDGERAILDPNGELVGYLLPVADRLKLEARTVESQEVFCQEADKNGPHYTTQEVLAQLDANR